MSSQDYKVVEMSEHLPETPDDEDDEMNEDDHSSSLNSNINITAHKEKFLPTRFERIGEMSCLFLSFYREGKYPFCNVGPSRGPMVFMLVFAGFVTGYLYVLIQMFAESYPRGQYLAYLSMFINVVLFFLTMCGDPGIEDVIYEHYYKTRYGQKLDEEAEDDLENMDGVVSTIDEDDEEDLDQELEDRAKDALKNRKVLQAMQIPEHSNEKYQELFENDEYRPRYFMKK